jgi:hypothetical protein
MHANLALFAALAACSGSAGPAREAARGDDKVHATAPSGAAPRKACVQLVLVQHNGGQPCADCIDRAPGDAERRARELQQRLLQGADFAELARTESDAEFGSGGDGTIGTFREDGWPEELAPIRSAVFALKVGEIAAQPLAIDFGFVLVRRCGG